MDIHRVIEMASIMVGVAGVAQQLKTANAAGGGGSGAPTSVSIATTETGGTNNAVLAEEGAASFGGMDVVGSDFSNGQGSVTVDIDAMGETFPGVSGQATINFFGYLRATGATSFSWDVAVDTIATSLSAGTAATQGTAVTTQDATGSGGLTTGINEQGTLTFGGGRGGLIFPSNGDVLQFVISGSATNSSGTTNASNVTVRYTFSS
tara:strand:- start:1738 stop:2358 length:621 start_codon:yes stop_codon:yes gene_type:complete